ncbi:MAG: NAD(+) synthase [Chloroflexi bacterium]|nr:NAD(+) synthase [Anaerolineaceae bacterium]NLI45108.1 NAD(+) synthase [Chloroflexota bacterium]HOE34360.1 NAD(+) synthase [Anaerolineaceae bacterium]HOT25641.1 NAD(+) synthase [Anaerolineaceae bacterium]HQH57275.1 NAD(+) synthase [Anaerolineaceae bacterium]
MGRTSTPQSERTPHGLQLSVFVPELRVADVDFNLQGILRCLEQLAADSPAPRLALFPELSLTGCTCGDLFLQPLLAASALQALPEIASRCRDLGVWALVGLPYRHVNRLYNAAALFSPVGPVGLSLERFPLDPVSGFPSRWFSAGSDFPDRQAEILGRMVPAAADLSLTLPELYPQRLQICVGRVDRLICEVCVGLLLNPCALPALSLAGQFPETSQVLRGGGKAYWAYASCGPCESTAEVVFSGRAGIVRDGETLAQAPTLQFTTQRAHARIAPRKYARRQALKTAADQIPFEPLSQTPFLSSSQPDLQSEAVFAIQTAGLIGRLRHTGLRRLVLGLSGGADSSLALLVCWQAFRLLNLEPRDILAVSMPGPGTTKASLQRLRVLAELCQVSLKVIPITGALAGHLRDIDHPPDLYDVTYENAQARERTQILLDLANQNNALMIGTGDLSEIALGWCTFNGDQTSHYHVNAGLPKTLVLRVLAWAGGALLGAEGAAAAASVCAASISPELLPTDADGTSPQSTEAVLGPYLLHDFFIFHALANRLPPREVYRLAVSAFAGRYSSEKILRWLRLFYRRFFSQQFKRSAGPEGPRVGAVSLSARSAWMVPADVSGALWLRELEGLETNTGENE